MSSGTLSSMSALAELPQKFHFELSLAQWSLHKAFFSKEISPLDFPVIARKTYDIGAVEYVNQFFLDKAKDKVFLTELKKRCEDNGVVSSLIMIDKEPELSSPDPKERAAGVEGHKKWIDAAKFLGCTAIRINLHGNGTLEQWTQGSVESLRKLSAIGKPLGIKILVENHGGFSSSGKNMSEVMRLANDANIGTMPDFGNFCIRREVAGDLWKSACVEQYDIYQGVAEMMPYAGAFSAKSFNFDEQGNESGIDFLAMFKIMRASKYRGYVGIEYEGEKLSEDAGIRATKKLIEKVRAQLSNS
ncbi:xylose isomerase [Cellvibrio zantedeschiae]|uniref:Xylose isomerase n=1 Tax=Cellvibrio zantedeschiae TaxID=1237077 RepID=A0ABQ3B9H3_9GAMM|nr:sugar phosphate isomerase/epimerase family protein [Cellvibrio zantedeschiae]GGY85891.1 xylose isomerase [Cellvibrio zantedeschiae]